MQVRSCDSGIAPKSFLYIYFFIINSALSLCETSLWRMPKRFGNPHEPRAPSSNRKEVNAMPPFHKWGSWGSGTAGTLGRPSSVASDGSELPTEPNRGDGAARGSWRCKPRPGLASPAALRAGQKCLCRRDAGLCGLGFTWGGGCCIVNLRRRDAQSGLSGPFLACALARSPLRLPGVFKAHFNLLENALCCLKNINPWT